MKTPDFAFPKTAAKNAQSQLKSAINNDDAKKALEALIISCVANGLIDPSTIPSSIEETEATAMHFANNPMHGMFDALLATMYSNYYQNQKWTYDKRTLPLTPLPQDISEWSGQQFKAKIRELCLASFSNPEGLSQYKTADFSTLIECDKESLRYFPTLLDFVYQNALSISESAEGIFQASELEKMAKEALKHEASQLYWDYVTLCNSDCKLQDWQKAFEVRSNNPLASIFLIRYYRDMWRDNFEQKKWLNDAITEFLRVKDATFTPRLKDISNQLTQPNIKAVTPQYCTPESALRISVNNQNVRTGSVAIFKITATEAADRNLNCKKFQSRTPIQTFELRCTDPLPFGADTVIEAKLKEPGFYAVLPAIGGIYSEQTVSVLHCIPTMPISLSGTTPSYVLAVNPATGAPMRGVNIRLKEGKSQQKIPTTDGQGLSKVPQEYLLDDHRYYPSLTYGGGIYDFADITVSGKPKAYANSTSTVEILTDRSIYHPGDEIQWLAVAYKTKISQNGETTKKIYANQPLNVMLYNANYQLLETTTIDTDSMGRAFGKFPTPTEGLTGNFTIRVGTQGNEYAGRKNVMVSDYKMPDFELADIKTQRNVDGDSTVTITGKAVSYSGMPMADASIVIVVSKGSWWRWFAPNEEVCTVKTTTDNEGNFTQVLTAAQLGDGSSPFYMAAISATSASGSTAQASTAFSTGPQYIIQLDTPVNVDALQPYAPSVKVASVDGEDATIDLIWKLKSGSTVVAEGKWGEPISLKDITPAIYNFVIEAADPKLADPADANITVYNTKTDIVPGQLPLWVCNSGSAILPNAKNEAELLIGYQPQSNTLYYTLTDTKQGELLKVGRYELQKGYHLLKIPVPADNPNIQLDLISVRECKTQKLNFRIGANDRKGLKIVGESFRDNLVPTATETWKLCLTTLDGKPAEGAMALDMYNKALEAIKPHTFALSLYSPYYISYNLNISTLFPRTINNDICRNNPYVDGSNQRLEAPSFNFYGYVFSDFRDRFVLYDLAAPLSRSMEMERPVNGTGMVYEETAVSNDAMPAAMPEKSEKESEAAPEEMDTQFDYRDADVPLAIWAPQLCTDAEGNVVYTFQVPNANTTWRLRAVAWNRDLLTGSLMRDFVASKPVMVQPNLPRFLRVGDQAAILASVMNSTDSTVTAITTIELFNPATGEVIHTCSQTDTIAAKSTVIARCDVTAPADMPAIGYRVRTSNGDFTDGEQSVIKILPSESQLIETEPFYLNPGEKEYSTTLPSAKDARLSLTFSENPAWTIVSALPGLREEVGTSSLAASAAILSAAISQGISASNPAIADALKHWLNNPSDSALVSMLQKNDDLKQALLNCTPWVQAAQSDTERMANLALIFNEEDVQKSIEDGIALLKKLQNSDGGWRWGEWSKESSWWITGAVLENLGYTKSLGWLPADKELERMISKAVAYYDQNVYTKKASSDMFYCLIRAYFPEIPLSLKGQATVKATTKYILKHWKSCTDPVIKAESAIVLHQYNYPAKAKELMASLSEFGVWTPSQGLKYPSVNSLTSYAIILEAYSTILPADKAVDGLRQQLVVRKQGTNWGTAVVTTQVITSILQSGSNWMVPAKGAEIIVGDNKIEPSSQIEHATGTLRADLSGMAGQKLVILTSGLTPAYGAVYAQYSQPMDSVKSSNCDDLSIEKRITVRRGDNWIYAPDTLQVGDRVKVMLTVHCKRNLNYVTIIDDRAATLAPVDQLPGWIYSEGISFYRENRNSFTGLYVDYLYPGTYQLTYEMDVTIGGNFFGGVATIQSQYAPEISAHSAGHVLTVK